MFKKISLHQIVAVVGLVLLVLWFVGNFYWGERLYAGPDGVAWDSALYADMTIHIEKMLQQQQLSQYYIQRILPSTIVHYVAKIFCLPLENHRQVVSYFYVYNCILFSIAALFLWKIGSHFGWKLQIRVISFAAIFLNFPVLKHSTYNTVLTDYSALAISVIMLYFFLKRSSIGLIFTTLIGAFIFPTFIYIGILFICFPLFVDKGRLNREMGKGGVTESVLHFLLSLIMPALVIALLFYTLEQGWMIINGANQINSLWFPVSVICLFIYLYLASKPFAINVKNYWFFLPPQLSLWRIMLGIILFIGIKYIIAFAPAGGLTIVPQLMLVSLASVVNPLAFLVAHTFYFGPLVLILIFLWKDFIEEISSYGLGLTMFVLLYMILSIGTESRQAINAWPIFAVFISQVLNRHYLVNWCFTYALVGIGLGFSRFWFQINTANMHLGTFLEFPQQRYFVTSGPWMSNEMYYVHSVAVLCIAIALYCLLKTLPKKV